MRSHNERQLEKFIKLRQKYGEFVRVNNVCVFRSKNKRFCVNIDLYLIQTNKRNNLHNKSKNQNPAPQIDSPTQE